MTPSARLRRLFDVAVAAAQPALIVPPALPAPGIGRNIVVGAGKASAAMAAALEQAWPEGAALEGLVVTRYGHAVACDRIEIAQAAHPVPDAAGRAAAARILDLVAGLGPDDQVIALISGGGSALLTLPPADVPEAEMAALNAALLASGAAIDQINCIRRHLSRISGGRLAAAAYPARLTALLISDVPGDDPADIASGPTVADPTTLRDALAVVGRYGLTLPPAIAAALADPASESLKPGDPRLANATTRIIAAPMASLLAAAQAAQKMGLHPEILGDALEGEAQALGLEHAALALAQQASLRPGDAPLVLLSGGETTVTLPADCAGRGGRNVDYLLGLAQGLNGAPGIDALAADTDGIDGIEPVAGAVICPETAARAATLGLSLERAIKDHDGHSFFEALGDQVVTGPTLTNVNDFRAILVAPSGQQQ